MKVPTLSKENRGQVGIGTLIVFIALVLVAAIAAGVLINTAGFLQTQAEATGQESTSQVSDNLNVISTLGQLNDAPDAVGAIKITVSKGPGSGLIDLEQLTLEYVGPSGSTTLTASSTVNTDTLQAQDADADYGVSTVSSSTDDDEFVLAESSDQYILTIGLGAENNGDGTVGSGGSLADLSGGQEATVTITTSQGSQRTIQIQVPNTIQQLDANDEIRV